MPPRKKTEVAPQKPGLFAVVGSDEGETKRRARELSQELSPKEGGDFAVEIIDGAAENAEQAIRRIHQTVEAIQTLPFFGSQKLVWLKDVNFLSDSVTARSAGVQAALEELKQFLEKGLPAGVSLLLSAVEVDKRRTFFKWLVKAFRVEQFDRLDTSRAGWEEDVEFIVQRLAAEISLEFQPEALQLFVRLAGADTRQVRNELEKLDLYVGDGRLISVEIVRALVAKSNAGVIWDLSANIAKRQLGQSLQLLDQLLFQGETPIGILYAAIIPTVRNLMVTKDLLNRHGIRAPQVPFQFASAIKDLPEEAIRHLPRKKDGTINIYALGLVASDAVRFDLDELINGLDACLKANIRLVTTQLDPRLILGELLIRLATRVRS